MIDIRQTAEYANYLRSLGWIIERICGVNYSIKKLPIIGSVLKIQRPEKINHATIQQLAIKHRVFQVIIEPNLASVIYSRKCHHLLLSQGYKLSKSPYLPTKTLQLDLSKSKNQLFKEMKKDCRQAIRKNNELSGKARSCFAGQIINYKLKNLGKFRNAWKKAVGWKRYVPPLKNLQALKKAFWGNALFLTTKNCSSGAIFLLAEGAACYWQAFTSKEGRKKMYQYKIVWEGILWAKKMGARIFDFEGIYDERFPNKSWLGFTHFKKSFGGYEVNYPGCYTKFRFSL